MTLCVELDILHLMVELLNVILHLQIPAVIQGNVVLKIIVNMVSIIEMNHFLVTLATDMMTLKRSVLMIPVAGFLNPHLQNLFQLLLKMVNGEMILDVPHIGKELFSLHLMESQLNVIQKVQTHAVVIMAGVVDPVHIANAAIVLITEIKDIHTASASSISMIKRSGF